MCEIHGLPGIFQSVKLIIPHRDYSNTGAVSNYLSNITFFVRNVNGKTLLFHLDLIFVWVLSLFSMEKKYGGHR